MHDDSLQLDARNLAKRFLGHQAVADVSLCLRPGETVGLLGPNGAGKSVVFRMITGVLAPDAGTLSIDGIDVTALPLYARARCGLSYLPQEPSIFRGLSVEDNILLYLETHEPEPARRAARLEELLAEAGLHAVRHQIAARLSGGQKRRCEIARMLAARPRYLLLDEPFAGIDPRAIARLQDVIRALVARGVGVLISDHNVRDTLAITDRTYIIAHGRILMEGPPSQIVADTRAQDLWLGQRFRI